MVVNQVQKNGNTPLVTFIYQPFKIIRSAVGILNGIWINTIVPPVAVAGYLRNRHQFYCADPGFSKFVEPWNDSRKSSFRGKRTNVQLVQYQISERLAPPRNVFPLVCIVINYLRRSVHAFRLVVGSRIG